MNNVYTFATSKVSHSLSALVSDKTFRPLTGEGAHPKLVRGRLFLYLSGREQDTSGIGQKATTGGRNTVAKCSPKERSTLPRRPKLQKYLSRLTSAVLCEDFRDGIQSSQAKCGKVQRTNLPFSISTDFRTSKQLL